LPIKSLRAFLPTPYLEIAQGALTKFFPDDFDIDLNGRTLPWEAAILIPFADEQLFLEQEKRLFDRGMQLTALDWTRNTTSFAYPSFFYNKDNRSNRTELVSTLKGFHSLSQDCSEEEIHHDYEKVGQFAFSCSLSKGVKHPMPDFPSLRWLNVTDLRYTEKYINKVSFKQILAVVPQCEEDLNGGAFEDWIYDYVDNGNSEMFVNFPRQVEAVPISFEDPFSVYQINMDKGNMSIRKLRQEKNADQYRVHCNLVAHQMNAMGIHCDEVNTLVTVQVVSGTEYDELSNVVYKTYSSETFTLPMNLVMKKRSSQHYLNVTERCTTEHGRIKTQKPAICFNQSLLGVMGSIKNKDPKNKKVKIEIDKEQEESKIHNPFLAENFLRRELTEAGILDNKGKKDK
jgi:5'-3' exonuclease